MHTFTTWGIIIINNLTEMEFHGQLMKYHDPELMHTCINIMLIIRSVSLFCYTILFSCIIIFICVALVSGGVPQFKFIDKLPGVKNFIDSKSRNFDTEKDGADAECSICLQLFSEDPSKKLAELNCSQKHKFH